MKALVTLTVSSAILVFVEPVSGQPPVQPPMGPFGRGGWTPWGGGATGDWLTWVALIAAVVFLVLWIVERRKASASAAGDTPLEILKRRYARGEIDSREFEARRRGLL